MVNDRKQDPISLNEVLGAIDAWEARRAEASVDDETFNKFQKIKKTHYLPADARIEVISNFDNGDGDTCYIWSVRIVLPIASQPGRTYAFVIREQYVGVSSINSGKIAWGKPLENGIQAGFRLIPDQHEFLPGQQVRVEVFYRSVFGQEREGTLPNHFTIGEANVSDSEGNTVETETVRKELIIGGAQSAMISEEPLVVNSATLLQFGVDSHGEHAAHEQDHQATHAIVIKAKPGQKLRLSLKVTDLLTGDGSLVQTGDMEIQVAK